MTLKIEKQEDDQRQMAMTVEVPEDRVEQAMRVAARKLAKDFHIPGFRRGKAPYNVVLRRIGRDALRADAIEGLVQPVLEEALEESEAELYGKPSLDDMEMEPLVFKFTIPLAPSVQLPDYRALRKEVEPVVVSEEALAEALEQVRERHAVVEEVDRPSAAGDMITVSGKGELMPRPTSAAGTAEGPEEGEPQEGAAEEGAAEESSEGDAAAPEAEAAAETTEETERDRLLFDRERMEVLLDDKRTYVGTPFVENMIGLTAGDEKAFSFTFPDDFDDEDLAGREASFNLTLLNVKSRTLPELDDDLAKQEGNHESVDELRASVQERLQKQAEAAARNELIEGMIDELLEGVVMVYPPAVVEAEIDNYVEEFQGRVKGAGWEWQDFLKLQGGSEAQIRENYREQATEKVRRQLAMRQLVLDEQLTVEAEDVEAAVGEKVGRFVDNQELKESMEKFYRSGVGLEMISSEVLMDKVHGRILEIYAGNAPDLEAGDEEAGEEEE